MILPDKLHDNLMLMMKKILSVDCSTFYLLLSKVTCYTHVQLKLQMLLTWLLIPFLSFSKKRIVLSMPMGNTSKKSRIFSNLKKEKTSITDLQSWMQLRIKANQKSKTKNQKFYWY